MDMMQLKRVTDGFLGPKSNIKDINEWLAELRGRAAGMYSHYRGDIDFRFARNKRLPYNGLLGTQKGFMLSMDLSKRYQFQPEYNSLMQELTFFGYSKLKMMESIDPSALSGIMTLLFEKRRNLEDRTMNLLGNVNQVLKSIISLIYELKELDRNLAFYDLMKSSAPEKKEAAELALKRIFVDNVDARKGGASLVRLSGAPVQGQGGAAFADLVGAFYAAKSLRDIGNMQRNEQYKNILKNRYIEYEEWKKINDGDLRSRRNLLLGYLKSQVGSYNLYVEWASQYLTMLKRINLTKPQTAASYMGSTKMADIFESSIFTLNVMGFKEIYRGEYEVGYKKVFNNKGIEMPVSATLKSESGALLTRGHSEDSRTFIRDRIRKYGPKVIAAMEVTFGFREKQFFPKITGQSGKEEPMFPQNPGGMVQYEGTLDIKIAPYCFTLEEWLLFRKAQEANIQKTVFEGVDVVARNSLYAIKKDLDKYLTEAENKDKNVEKKSSSFALMDIYNSFKDDLLGINRSLSVAGGGVQRPQFDPVLYEIAISNRFFHHERMRDALSIGLFVSSNDASTIYEEFKRRARFLTPLQKFDMF